MGNTYRPTVRYDEAFRVYVDDLFRATTLDRNQIMRLSLFLIGHTEEGKRILKKFLKSETISLPSPSWMVSTDGLWLGKTIESCEGGRTPDKDVTEISLKIIDDRGEGRHVKTKGLARSIGEISRPRGEICYRSDNSGGIRVTIE